MRTFVIVILALSAIGVGGIAAVMYLTAGPGVLARQFVVLSSTGNYDAARALLHPQLQKDFPPELFEERFARVAPYTEVSFASVETTEAHTRLQGRATTASGCASGLAFELREGQITAFEINPLCTE
ncbi:hypothetical protein Ga0609869_003022 [Rhodovulum iodosum]|uniref:Uncharacterized protein n=1 Tax=Rhodovulum iodosum TaxID=68291 RepID=A0ABV3XWY9_9RHOB|nr:hypothetical protein [Rhodovulum robiginosum]RSK36799.1 hypothetical protein EJA01_04700 [Rhodovulum robiginosum]